MKCPKCRYVSFEYLENCKKCGSDLTEHKTAYSIGMPVYASLGIPSYIVKNSATAKGGSIAGGGDVAAAEGSAVPDIAGEAFQEVASAKFDAEGTPVVDDESSDAVAIAKEVGDIEIDISGEGETDEPQEEVSIVEEEEEKEIAFTGLGEEPSPLEPVIEVAEVEAKDDDEIEISLDGIEISIEDSGVAEEQPGNSSQPIYEDTSSIVLDEDALEGIADTIDEDEKKKGKKAKEDINGDDSLVVNLDDLDLD